MINHLPLFLALLPASLMAEQVHCMIDGVPVQFAIDYAQFAPPMNPSEPTQRRTTTVQMGDARFPAEPILMGDVRGFWAEGTDAMMVMQGDGSAVYASADHRLTGRCEVQK